MSTTNLKLDARGLSCPLPILSVRKALHAMAAGQTLEVKTTDPGSMKDIEAFCNQTGHNLLSSVEENTDYISVIVKI